MSRIVRLVMTLAVALLPVQLAAQGSGTVSGRVIDQGTQRPLSDVTVSVVGTQRGTMTDQQGRYTISGVPAGAQTIRARRIGFEVGNMPVTVGAGVTATADFALRASATELQEVVVNAVTGREERRIEVGTNVGNVNVADMNRGPITSTADILQGRVAGVTLQTATGTTGGGQRTRIRGANSLSLSNEPLLVIDGVVATNSKGGIALGGQDYSRMNDINPEEIENIEILKGPAAAAIYGTAAASGVIQIRTKRGTAGAPQWRAYAEAGQLEDVNPWPLNYVALTRFGPGEEYYLVEDDILNIRSIPGNSGAPFDICPNYRAALAPGTAGACTQDVALSFDQFRDPRTTFLQTGSRTKFGLNVSGGSEALTYFISGDQERENGVLRPNDLERISLRSNLNARIGRNATSTITAAYIRTNTHRMSNDNSVFSPIINALLGPAQYLPGMESDTVSRAGARRGSWFGYNTADQRLVTAFQDVDRFIIGSNFNITPLSWLRVNANAGLDFFSRFDHRTQDPNKLPLAQSYILGFRNGFRSDNYIWTSNASGAATFNFTPSLVSTTTIGGSFSRSLFEQLECYGVGIPTGTESCAATTSQFAVDETHTDFKTVGAFVREELSFADRLFLSGTIRTDNNSGLLRNVSGLAFYPGFNASWVVSQEPFFPRASMLSQLRLRMGWGQSGLRPGFGAGDTFFGSRVVQAGGVEIPALILTNTGNPNLKVEKTTELEGGFDIGFFDDRVTAEFTAFRKRSKDALVSRNLAPSSGLTGTVWENLGSVKNWGTEYGLNAMLVNRGPVRLDARLTGTTLRNRIENLGVDPRGQPIAPIIMNRGWQQHREGFPVGAYFATPLKYSDADGNGKLSRAEVSIDSSKFLVVPDRLTGGLDTLNVAFVGPIMPTSSQGISGDLTLFGNLTLSTLFERRAGHKQLNATEAFRCRTQASSVFSYGQCAALADPNASLDRQAAAIGAIFFGNNQYFFIEDATFVKWREFSVRLGVPERLATQIPRLRGAAITLSGRNLKTWTDYTGIDPEINETGGSNFIQGEFNTQPPVRVWSLRFDFRL